MDPYANPYINYKRLVETKKTLETATFFSEEWMEEHKQHIRRYVTFLEGIDLRAEIDDERLIRNLEYARVDLMRTIHTDDMIELGTYYKFLSALIAVLDIVLNVDELTDLMSRL